MKTILEKYKIYLAIGLQILILLGVFASREFILATGKEIKLRPELYDPRDVFYGDYARLQFGINTFNGKVDQSIKYGNIVFAALKQVDDNWVVEEVTKAKPTEKMFLRAKVLSTYSGQTRLEYSFEKYFVEEGKGSEVQKMITDAARNPQKSANLILVVDSNGSAVVKGLVVEDATAAQKSASYDTQRLRDLNELKYKIEDYYNSYGFLPIKVEDIQAFNRTTINLTDPETKAPYGYSKVTTISYKLCATFGADSSLSGGIAEQKHKKGYDCITYNIPNYMQFKKSTYISPTPFPTYVIQPTPSIPQTQFTERKVTVLNPTWNETLCLDSSYTIKWITQGENLKQINLALYTRPDAKYYQITNLVSDTAGLYAIIVKETEKAGTYQWTVGATSSGVKLPPGKYYMAPTALFGTTWIGGYGGDFTIKDCSGEK